MQRDNALRSVKKSVSRNCLTHRDCECFNNVHYPGPFAVLCVKELKIVYNLLGLKLISADEINARYHDAYSAMIAENYTKALIGFQSLYNAIETDDSIDSSPKKICLHGIGQCSERLGDHDRALKSFISAFEIEQDAWTALKIADIHYFVGSDVEGCLEYTMLSLELDKNYEPARKMLAVALHARSLRKAKAKDFKGSYEDALGASEVYPENPVFSESAALAKEQFHLMELGATDTPDTSLHNASQPVEHTWTGRCQWCGRRYDQETAFTYRHIGFCSRKCEAESKL